MEVSISRRLQDLHKAETPLLDSTPPHVPYPASHSIQARSELVDFNYKTPGLFHYHFGPAQATAGLEQPDEVCHKTHDDFDQGDGSSDDEEDLAAVLEKVACIKWKAKQFECQNKIRKQVEHITLLLQTARREEMWVIGFTYYSVYHGLVAQEPRFEDVCLDRHLDYDEQLTGKTLLSCKRIWNRLLSLPSMRAGTFDIDGFRAHMRARAQCTECGIAVEKQHVDAAIQRFEKPSSEDAALLADDDTSREQHQEFAALLNALKWPVHYTISRNCTWV